MTEQSVQPISPAEEVKLLLEQIAKGGKDEASRVVELAKQHNLPNVEKALNTALELREEFLKNSAPAEEFDFAKERARLNKAFPDDKPAKKPIEPLKLRLWSEVRIPEGANDLERLTYVPGLVGDMTEWIVSGARRPNRVMALGVAVVVVGTIIGRLIKGPTGSCTHLYIINRAPTGYGKDWPLQGGAILMDSAGLPHLIGTHRGLKVATTLLRHSGN